MAPTKKRARRKRRPGWKKASGPMPVLIDENKRAFEPVEVYPREFDLVKLPDPPTDERVPPRRRSTKRRPT